LIPSLGKLAQIREGDVYGQFGHIVEYKHYLFIKSVFHDTFYESFGYASELFERYFLSRLEFKFLSSSKVKGSIQ